MRNGHPTVARSRLPAVLIGIDGDFTLSANIFTAGADGKNVARLTNDDIGVLNEFATWSPDGKLIAFVSNREGTKKIFVMNADGSNQHSVTTGGYYSSLSWAPDGSKILFVAPGIPNGCYNVSCDEVYTISVDGSQLTQLTHYAGSYINPKYSPDGAKILFNRHLQTYYETHDFPFGARFYRDGGYAVFVMNADGNSQINISNAANDYDPDWQPLAAPANDPPPSILGLSSDLYLGPTTAPPKTEISVARSGNLNQAVSCDYQILWNGNVLGGVPQARSISLREKFQRQ